MIPLTAMSNSTIMLERAYLALRRQYWIAILGAALISPHLGFGFFILSNSPTLFNDDNDCVIDYPTYVPWYWLIASIPINTLFSGIFCYVSYKQYSRFGSSAWKRLAQDGIQTMCLVALCNIICSVIVVEKLFDGFSEMFFTVDCVITTTALAHMCFNARVVASSLAALKSSKSVPTTQVDIKETVISFHVKFLNTRMSNSTIF
ncbi:hypothetical protein BDF19DRAFT_88768 [Syncephalis fuscata]|nr:hypothetical protein BDF19DRAFT_88768 [Syncephalis fuscata]